MNNKNMRDRFNFRSGQPPQQPANSGISKSSMIGFALNPFHGMGKRIKNTDMPLLRMAFGSLVSGLGLIDRHDSQYRKAQKGEAGMADLIWHMLRNPKKGGIERVAELVILFAVLACIVMIAVAIGAAILYTVTGIAHANPNSNLENAKFDLFDPQPGDLGNDLLLSIFGGTQVDDSAGISQWVAGMRTVLGEMLRVYSFGALLLASLLVGYSLITMVTETAHSGKMLGRHNQIWAPIRIIYALAMLVPLSSGFNAGQKVMITVAGWGGALATKVWTAFSDNLTGEDGKGYIITPTQSRSDSVIQQALRQLVCVEVVNHQVDKGGIFGSFGTTKITPKITKYEDKTVVDYTNQGLNLNNFNANCGKTEIRAPGQSNDKEAAKMILKAHEDAFVTAMRELEGIAKIIVQSSDVRTANPEDYDFFQFVPQQAQKLKDIQKRYDDVLAKSIQDAVVVQQRKIVDQIGDGARREGWAAAGGYFHRIAMLNSQLMTAVNSTPKTDVNANDSALPYYSEPFAKRAYERQQRVISAAYKLPAANTPGATGANNGNTDVARTPVNQDNSNFLTAIWAIPFNMNVDGTWGRVFGDEFVMNPMAKLIWWGQQLMNVVQIIFWILIIMSGGSFLLGLAGAGLGAAAGAGLASGPAALALGLGGVALGAVSQGIATVMSILFAPILLLCLTVGLNLAFLLPLLPAIRFVFEVLTWLMSLFEAVVAIPVVALAHLKTDGEGFAPQMAHRAYQLALLIFLRPVLTIFGLMAAIMLMTIILREFNKLFFETIQDITETQSMLGFLSFIGFNVIYGSTAYSLCVACCNAIDTLPDHVLGWIGISGSGGYKQEAASAIGNNNQMLGLVLGSQTLGGMQNQFGAAQQSFAASGREVGQAYKDWREGSKNPPGGGGTQTPGPTGPQKSIPMDMGGNNGGANGGDDTPPPGGGGSGGNAGGDSSGGGSNLGKDFAGGDDSSGGGSFGGAGGTSIGGGSGGTSGAGGGGSSGGAGAGGAAGVSGASGTNTSGTSVSGTNPSTNLASGNIQGKQSSPADDAVARAEAAAARAQGSASTATGAASQATGSAGQASGDANMASSSAGQASSAAGQASSAAGQASNNSGNTPPPPPPNNPTSSSTKREDEEER